MAPAGIPLNRVASERTHPTTPLADARLRSGIDSEVCRALEFYRSVGASHDIREGEALLAHRPRRVRARRVATRLSFAARNRGEEREKSSLLRHAAPR